MSAEEEGGNGMEMTDMVPRRPDIPHYHGGTVRGIFVISAILIIIAESTGANLPLSTGSAVIAAVMLVVAAGITNPAITWIHWVNSFFAAFGTILFGMPAVALYRSGLSVLDPSFFYIEALTLLSLIALYLTTRTIRGILMRQNLPH